MTGRQASGDTPAGSNGRERLEDEAPLRQPRVRNGEPAGTEPAAAPQQQVEIEDSGPPALARPAAKLALQGFQALEHLRRVEIAFDERHGIGEIAPGAAVGRVEHDRRCVKQAERLIEARDCGFDDLRRPPETAVRAVGADREGVEVRGFSHQHPFAPSLPKGGLSCAELE
jgi:hypothetical protein